MSPYLSPILSPSITTPPSLDTTPSVSRQLSTTSIQGLADFIVCASTSSHLPERRVEVVKEEGLRHAKISLEARHYKTPVFAAHLLDLLRTLRIPSWSNSAIKSEDIVVRKISGALTNAVFFVSSIGLVKTNTLLLRIYGPSSGSLISRPRELHTLHMLSSQYHIGPIVYGTFENGRIEEYFESTTLTPNDIRDPLISRWIGARMAELHSVDIDVVEGNSTQTGEPKGRETGVERNVRSWLAPARQVLALPSISDIVRRDLDLHRFEQEWHRYMLWLSKVDDLHTGRRRVFAHNDTQYGNLLRLKHPSEGLDEHRQIIVVDFEYASSNPAAFDIANHFHEWTANYHSSTPHLLDFTRYPSFQERRNFYIAYVQHTTVLGEDPVMEAPDLERLVLDLDQQVRNWSPASHAMWAIWGIVQAREDIEGNIADPEFDYIGYARGRLAAFRKEIQILGL